MSRRINLLIMQAWRSYYLLEVLIDDKKVSCKKGEIFYSKKDEQLKAYQKKELIPVKVSDEWLAELDTFNIFSWEKEYQDFWYGTDGIYWSLTFEDNGKIYNGHGRNVAHKNWSRFMDWLGVIFKEIES